jgi:hypothetical protein
MVCVSRLARMLVAATGLLAIIGCAEPKLINDRAARFSSALTTTTTNVRESFVSVNRAHANAEIEAIINADLAGKHPKLELKPFLSGEQLALRMSVLEGLDAYSAKLLALTGADPKGKVGEAIDGVGQTLVKLDLTKLNLDSIPKAQVDSASSALKKIGAFLIDVELGRKLPPLIEQMHPSVVATVNLLIADIGDPETVGTLRAQMSLAHKSYRLSHAQNIGSARRANMLGFSEYRIFMRDLITIDSQAKAADAAMEQTVVALRRLVDTHAKLAQIADDSQEVDVMIERLSRAARDIRDIHRLTLAAAGQS